MVRPELVFSDKLEELAALLAAFPAVFVVADKKIMARIVEPMLDECICRGVAVRGVFPVKISEKRKTYRTIEKIQRWLIGVGADRDAFVLAVGGGILTDLVGFAASTYMRGVRYANVPTTLLAMCDASVGGKTACNIDGYKNMAGTFSLPQFTFVNVDYVRGLDWDQIRDGYAEMLKTFIVADADAYDKAINDRQFDFLSGLVEKAAGIKAEIVGGDLYENGKRKFLNLGHTFAHAIERRSSFTFLRKTLPGEGGCFGWTMGRISHGSAVAMGIVMAARKSEREGVAQKGLVDRLVADFGECGLPTECPWTERELEAIMRKDKKACDGVVHYVLIERIGKVVVI